MRRRCDTVDIRSSSKGTKAGRSTLAIHPLQDSASTFGVVRPSVIVTDLDGTLWGTDMSIDQLTHKALDTLRDLDIPVLAATARGAIAAKVVYERNNITLPSVLLNGGLGRDFATDVTFHRMPLDADVVKAVAEAFESAEVSPYLAIESDGKSYVRTRDASGSKEFFDFYSPYVKMTEELHDALQGEAVFQIAATGIAHDDAEKVQQRLSGVSGALGFVMREPNWLDVGDTTIIVQSADAGKWTGVLAYCERYGFDSSNVLAVGDGVNDLDLLTNATKACVMNHAPTALKEIADVVLPADSGWSAILGLI